VHFPLLLEQWLSLVVEMIVSLQINQQLGASVSILTLPSKISHYPGLYIVL
jgi:hypothetical protein